MRRTTPVLSPASGRHFLSQLCLLLTFAFASMLCVHVAQAEPIEPSIGSEWIGSPRWMWGVPWGESSTPRGGETFYNSIGKGKNFLGSSIPAANVRPVEIRFDGDSSRCSFFVQDQNFSYNGVGIFGGSAWDMTDPLNPVRLNVCIAEQPASGNVNRRWNPDATGIARREYVIVMGSTYDSTGQTYVGKKMIRDAPLMDIMYVWYPRVQYPYDLFASPATLRIYPLKISAQASAGNTRNTLQWSYLDDLNQVSRFRIRGGTIFPPPVLDSVDRLKTSYTHEGLTNHLKYYYRIDAIDQNGDVIANGPELDATPDSMLQLLGRWHERSGYGGIWGYTEAATSKEYALICSREVGGGVSVIDIDTDPPSLVSFMPGSNDCKEVKVYKHYVITCNENFPAQIYDISNISNPQLVATVGTGSHTHNVYKDYLILNGGGVPSGFDIYSIIDPSNPVKIGQYRNFYFHDTGIRNDTLAGAGIYGQGIDFVDISNPSAPVRIGGFNYPNSGAHGIDFSPDGKYVYINNELGSEPWGKIFDISDLNNVTLTASMIESPNAISHNGYYKDGFFYLAYYTEGATVWDVRDPYLPVRVARYDTYFGGNPGFSGCWTVYPYFASERLIASDLNTGLYVLRFKSPSTDVDDGTGEGETILPTAFTLEQNYPNPFNPETTIEFALSQRSAVKLTIYNSLGQRVTTLVDEMLAAGNYSRVWDGTSSAGRAVATGVYYAVMESNGAKMTKKMVMLK